MTHQPDGYACGMHLNQAMAGAAVCALLAGCGAGDDGGAAGDAGDASKRDAGQRRVAAIAAPQRPMTTVPRLVGHTDVQAHRLARKAGLELRFPGFPGSLANGHHEVRCVKIQTQSPAPGERRPRGAKVWVVETTCKLHAVRPRGG